MCSGGGSARLRAWRLWPAVQGSVPRTNVWTTPAKARSIPQCHGSCDIITLYFSIDYRIRSQQRAGKVEFAVAVLQQNCWEYTTPT
jgi:hypothetical protein